MILLPILLQTAVPAIPIVAPPPQRWSILNPPACPGSSPTEIIVCGGPAVNSPRLPLPDERGPPDRAVASNPELSAVRALQLEGTPCAASQRGCQVGFGPPIAPIAKAAVGLIKSALAKKPDKRGRVPIDLDGPVGTVN